jgi:hypothetical protein
MSFLFLGKAYRNVMTRQREKRLTDGPRRGFNTYFVSRGAARWGTPGGTSMTKFLLWAVLFVLCWPVALLALVLYPVVWLILLPFRLVGLVVEGVFEFLRAIVLLPARLMGGRA